MLAYFRSWMERRRLKGRGLFVYHDGERTRYADPFPTLRALRDHPTMNFDAMLPLAAEGETAETEIMVKGLCDVFGVKRWNGCSGMTEQEIFTVLYQFLDYLAALKKSISPGPTLPQPTDSQSSTGDTPPDGPTNVSLDSGYVPSEVKSESPTASPMESSPESAQPLVAN